MNNNGRGIATTMLVHTAFFLLVLSFFPLLASAQSEYRHATLLGWEGDIKRYVLDRAHNYGGSHYPRGLFRNQVEFMTAEHELDLMTYQHTAIDDYAWTRQHEGYRLFAGSLNAKYFAVENHIKSQIEINEKMNFGIDGVHLENFRANRFFMALEIEKKFTENHRVGFYHTLTRDKGDLDAGVYYQYGNFDDGMIKVETTFLNYSSNITEGLAEGSGMMGKWYDEVHFYDKQSQLLSTTLVSPQLVHFRGEAVVGVQTKMDKRVLYANGDEFRDREWAHYAGGLLEYYNDYVTVGLTYKRTFSKLKRVPLEGSPYEPTFGNWQISDKFGAYASGDITNNMHVEQWVYYEFFTDRLQGDTAPEGFSKFDFEEERLKLKSRVLYDDQKKGLTAGIEFHADYRYPQTKDELSNYKKNSYYQLLNKRLTGTIGYRINPHFHMLGGVSYDVDRDKVVNKENYAWFDGGFGRLVVTW